MSIVPIMGTYRKEKYMNTDFTYNIYLCVVKIICDLPDFYFFIFLYRSTITQYINIY